ncbi:CIR protein PIR protein [Plasmodium vinckei lentum]|uniref:CIR protein PIR protein n=1 Tax=Plasmodium vinckei lentum TaxID=138297 RepID=A0A6V7STA6_PLAVN|nr:CIR protein PIR protein [Plasmodium vinckei lentum]
MEPKELCENFIAADNIINGEIENNLTVEQIINDPNFNKYCPNNKCKRDMQLDVLSEYLFNQLGIEIKDEYYEYFMMWLSDKLFKIAKEDDITLNEAYDKYLKDNIVNFNYWSLLDIKEGLKEVNLMHMKHFYKLLNDICKAIVYYKPNDDDIKKFIINSTECYNQYSSLYKSVPKCNSYLHLLDNLKKTYEDFKNSVHDEIKNICPELEKDLQTLTIENTNSYFVEYFKAFDFNSSECNPQKSKTGKLSRQNGSENSKSKPKDSENSKGNSNSKNGSSGGGKDSGENGGSKTPGDQDGTNSSGTFYGYWSSTLGSRLNFLNYLPSASEIYETPKNILISATDKISDTYTNTVNIVKGAYDSTVNNIKDAYDRTMTSITDAYNGTTNYIGNVVNNVTIQLNSLSTSQLGDNQPGSNSLGDRVDTHDHSQPNPKQPVNPPPSLPPSPSPPSAHQSTPPSTPQPKSNQIQDPSSPKSVDSQTSSTPIHNCTVQQITPTYENIGSQTPPPGQGTLASSGSNSLNTKNGNAISVANVKVKEISSIWCIGSYNKCDIMGFSIIVISISIILTIIYKYLSLGCTSKSKRKKSMKRVINSIGGKRPIQITIKSYDRNKDLKPVINSVGRKKDPLLNIYKLMQADPVPFINVFFLLIFFVYKRQLNYLEL